MQTAEKNTVASIFGPHADSVLYSDREQRGNETLRRLHRLVDAGYVPDLGRNDVQDAIFLEHLAGGPSLILYGNGLLVATSGSGRYTLNPNQPEDQNRIPNEDEKDVLAVNVFLKTLRKPTWR